MGFLAALIIVLPHETEIHGKKVRVWRAREEMDFGHVTRIEKVLEKEKSDRYNPRGLAGIAFVSVYRMRLYDKLRAPMRNDFAPPFLLYGEDGTARQAPASEIVDLGSEFQDRGFYHSLLEHNAAVMADDATFHEATVNLEPVLRRPVMWGSCEEVANWTRVAEEQSSQEWEVVNRKKRAHALFLGWRTNLEWMSQRGARVLFHFS